MLFLFCMHTEVAGNDAPPPIDREFRGVVVATVANIDWPSSRDLSTEQQQAELIALLDLARELNFNAVLLQVRPACDALYASSIEPWSEYLTGQQGRPPDPYYDPLALAVEEAHKRGLELHAWINPFRARHTTSRSGMAPEHVSHARPAVVREYGRQLWLDPGDPQAREHTLSVIRDIVTRYDIDGLTDVARATQRMRGMDLLKPPGLAEAIDWTAALEALGAQNLDLDLAARTLGAAVKYHEDQQRVLALADGGLT
jgi:uncharacterized lipoprotein YddW (UPF0748 family)